jgi:predicted HicB family RNase H-like nuclease
VTSKAVHSQAVVLAARPYTFTLVQDDESGVWTSAVLEFPGAISEGDSTDEAIAGVREALEVLIEIRLEDGIEIPEPFQTREFSGRTHIRMNPELHRRAVMLAMEQGVSLNRWLSQAVARSAGTDTAAKRHEHTDDDLVAAIISARSRTDEEIDADMQPPSVFGEVRIGEGVALVNLDALPRDLLSRVLGAAGIASGEEVEAS